MALQVETDPATFAVAVEDLFFRYGDRTALNGLTFSVNRGEMFAFLGPNGGGKSTLFRVLSTLVPPGSGAVRFFGMDPGANLGEVRRRLGVVFQSPSLDKMLTVKENMLHQGHLYGLRGRDLEQRVVRVSEQLGLADRMKDRTKVLSGGLRRRVEVAKALLHEPDLLLLDEPTTGLDPGVRQDLWVHLEQLRRGGLTVLFTTHLTEEAALCGRLAFLDRGSIVAQGSPRELQARVPGDVILVDAPDPDAAAAVLRERFRIGARPSGGRLRLEGDSNPPSVQELMEGLGDLASGVEVRRPSLEDVFMKVTGHGLGEDAGETA